MSLKMQILRAVNKKTQNARCIGSHGIFADDTNTFQETLPRSKYGVSHRNCRGLIGDEFHLQNVFWM